MPTQLAAVHLLPLLDDPALHQTLKARHDHLRCLLTTELPDWEVPTVTGGQCLWVRLPYGDGSSFAQTALRHKIAILPGSGLDVTGRSEQYIRLHYQASQAKLTEAVHRLAAAWSAYSPPTTRAGARPVIVV